MHDRESCSRKNYDGEHGFIELSIKLSQRCQFNVPQFLNSQSVRMGTLPVPHHSLL